MSDMVAIPETLIPFAVTENLRGHSENFTLSKKSERGDIFTEIKHCCIGRRRFSQEIRRHASNSGFPIRSIHPALSFTFTINACNTEKVFI